MARRDGADVDKRRSDGLTWTCPRKRGNFMAAVVAALTLPYSQGQTEGRVNRLKLIKRSMYGRAKFDLLRQRVLYASTS